MRPEERDAACRVQTRAFHSDFLDGAPLERTLVGVTPDGTISSATRHDARPALDG